VPRCGTTLLEGTLDARRLRAGRPTLRGLRACGVVFGLSAVSILGIQHATAGWNASHVSWQQPVPGPTPSSRTTDLQNKKLIEEIRQLQITNQASTSPWRYLVPLAPTLAAVAAIFTFGLGWSTHRSESRRQKEQDRVQREAESIREFDAKFADVVTNLGSDSVSLQASAASVLAVFLGPRYTDFRDHVVRVVSANLRLPGDAIVRDLLVDVLGTALRSGPAATAVESNQDRIEPAVGSYRDRIELSGADLHGLDIVSAKLPDIFTAERANLAQGRLDSCDLWKSDLRHATLTGASLRRANLGQALLDNADISHALFRGCRATSASMRGVDARYAMFQGASLQSAHFEDADLRGARFEGANLADCYFLRARLDAGALDSIRRSQKWRTAHFDPVVYQQLIAGAPV
jgi:Pentapeptide repeats (9 copies)